MGRCVAIWVTEAKGGVGLRREGAEALAGRGEGEGEGEGDDLRERSCLLRCSLLLNALLQNWHLYLRSGASEALREAGVDEADVGRTATLAPGILTARVVVAFLGDWEWVVAGWLGKLLRRRRNGDDNDNEGELRTA